MSTPVARGLLWDVGVVFFKAVWELIDGYSELYNLPPGTFPGKGALDPNGDPIWQRYLAGEITEREYWLTYVQTAVDNGAPLNGHPQLMAAMHQETGYSTIRDEAQELFDDCNAAGIAQGILTNEMVGFQGRAWVESQPWFPSMRVLIDSTETGIRKPDPRAYQLAIDGMGIPANELVFIDDSPYYVEGGKAMGMHCVLLDVLDPAPAFVKARELLGL